MQFRVDSDTIGVEHSDDTGSGFVKPKDIETVREEWRTALETFRSRRWEALLGPRAKTVAALSSSYSFLDMFFQRSFRLSCHLLQDKHWTRDVIQRGLWHLPFFFFFYWITLEFGATNCDCFYWECDTITWCIFSMIVWVFSFWLLLLHSGFFHYHINWLGGEQTVPQQILLKDCFFFPLSRIRRYQHTVMNTSLDVVAKILDHCWSQVWDMQRRTIHHDILKYKRFFLGGKTRNRGGWGGNTLTSNTSWKAVAGSDSVAFIRALFYNPFPFLFAFPSSIYTLA